MQEGEGLIGEEEAAETLVRPINHRPMIKRALRREGGPLAITYRPINNRPKSALRRKVGRIGLQIQVCSMGMSVINRRRAVAEAIGAWYESCGIRT